MIIILTKTECPLFMNKVYGLALRLGGGGGVAILPTVVALCFENLGSVLC